MKVIPVIDLLNGVVVHAFRGARGNYKPLQSTLSRSLDPLDVAMAFKTLGFSELYVADLDAILDCSMDFQGLKSIVDETGLSLMVDAGVTSIERAQLLFESGVSKIVIGTETLQNKNFLAESVEQFGCDRVVLSLDLKGNEVLVKPGFPGCRDPMCLLSEFRLMGLSQVIVLDLVRVGSGEGVNFVFLKKIIDEFNFDVYVGGGVRDIADLVALRTLGVSGTLVATSLHTGKISIEDLKRQELL